MGFKIKRKTLEDKILLLVEPLHNSNKGNKLFFYPPKGARTEERAHRHEKTAPTNGKKAHTSEKEVIQERRNRQGSQVRTTATYQSGKWPSSKTPARLPNQPKQPVACLDVL